LFYQFLEKVRSAGVTAPIIPGIMPITNFSQIQRFKDLANCYIPQDLITELEQLQDDKVEFLKRSLLFTVEQCKDLLKKGVSGIHFYTLNQSSATIEVMKQLI
jgi:methylenetetrahydrofolate reductase (NADPH)